MRKVMHCCLGLAKHSEKITTQKQTWLSKDRGKDTWVLLNANSVRTLEEIKFCPYCGKNLEEHNEFESY